MKSRTQTGFRGVDERIRFSEVLDYASEMKNLRIKDGALTKKSGHRLICTVEDAESIDGIWCGRLKGIEKTVFSAGGMLYYLESDAESEPVLIGEVGVGRCLMFEYNGALYIMNSVNYSKYDGNFLSPVVGHVPCVATNCSPAGGGETYEQINLLSPQRRQLFSAEENAVSYKLAETNVNRIVSFSVDGAPYPHAYVLNSEYGRIDIEKPIPHGLNNVEVVYEMADNGKMKSMILDCTNATVFGGNTDERIFLWGNENYPNYRFHSELAQGSESAEYFPIDGFTVIGKNRINCIVQQYNKQLIFTENEAFYSYSELKNDSLGNTFASFPVFNLNSAKGCIKNSDGCIIDNKPVTICADGLNIWESSAIENEKNARCFSDMISTSLKTALNEQKRILFFDMQSDNELYLICGDTAYIYNYADKSWFVYDGFDGENYTVSGTKLYFSVQNSIYVTESVYENDEDIECMWLSPYVTLGQHSGHADVIGFEADIETEGEVSIHVTFEGSDGARLTERAFDFKDSDGLKRIELRPALKRVMPFRIRYIASGTGKSRLYNITLKTREKERSRRHGIQ